MRNVSNNGFRKNQNTFYVQWRFSENRAVYETMSKKYGGATEDADNMVPARGILDK
jgi:hypothetical protein